VGEWSVITGAGSNATGDLAAAVAEAAFMTVLERNSDIVAMQCYAPLFAFDGHTQWNPDLIGFDQLTAYGSTSYWAQVMFASNVGDQYIPVSTGSKDIYCSATLESKSGKIFVKVANLSGVSRDVLIVFQGSTAAEVAIEVLTGDDPAARNSLAEPRRVAPQRQALRGEGGKFKYAAPPHSVAMVRC
jgi:alpha-L-arabinofuranosidase